MGSKIGVIVLLLCGLLDAALFGLASARGAPWATKPKRAQQDASLDLCRAVERIRDTLSAALLQSKRAERERELLEHGWGIRKAAGTEHIEDPVVAQEIGHLLPFLTLHLGHPLTRDQVDLLVFELGPGIKLRQRQIETLKPAARTQGSAKLYGELVKTALGLLDRDAFMHEVRRRDPKTGDSD